ncbi:MAG: S-layer homology domain-containing protein, partial [Lawsonibacter sp.]
QEMFTLLYHALDVMDRLPGGDSGKTIADFTDSGSIASYAREAMAYLVKIGAVSGNNGQLSPTATTTRAQMVQVLYSLLEK